MGLVNTLYKRTALVSPYVEVFLRQLYWKNVRFLKKFNPNRPTNVSMVKNMQHVEFEKIIGWLKAQGIGEGSLLIVHSGYGELECTGLTPEQIIERLLDLVGPSGTLAMPVVRRYKEEERAIKNGQNPEDVTCKYNIRKTMVVTGMLPYTLMQREDAVISHHPYNPLCAVGMLAKEMMEHNLEGDAPSPHGPNSCWKYCYDHGAQVCSIGTDIEHHNTICHIAEEAFGDWYWPDDIWYNYRKFEIVDENKNSTFVLVKNRKEEWGKLHLAELNSIESGLEEGVMRSSKIDGVSVGYVDPQKMMLLLQKKNGKGYPYFVLPWEDVRKIN